MTSYRQTDIREWGYEDTNESFEYFRRISIVTYCVIG